MIYLHQSPAPASLALLGLGTAGVGISRLRRDILERKKRKAEREGKPRKLILWRKKGINL